MRARIFESPLKNRYILVRHGETQANKDKVFMGRLDYELTENGIRQARSVSLQITPDYIFSSPLKRALSTAKIISEIHSGPEIQIEESLSERSGGEIEGLKYSEIAKRYPDLWDSYIKFPLRIAVRSRFPDGESDYDVAKRMEDLFISLENKFINKTIALVTHSGVIQATRYLRGKSKEEIYLHKIGNCHIETI